MKDVGLYVRYTLMIVAFIVAQRAPALSSLAGCQEFLFGAGGGRHPSEDMRGARRVAEARIYMPFASLLDTSDTLITPAPTKTKLIN